MSVKLFRYVREILGLSAYEMARRLGHFKSTEGKEHQPDVRPYLYKESEAKNISLSDLMLLRDMSGLSDQDFWKLIEKSARND